MPRSQIAKDQTRTDGDARAGIDPAHDRVHVIADRVQTSNRALIRVQDTRIGIGCQTRGSANVAGVQVHRVVGRLGQCTQVGVFARPSRVANVLLISRHTALEIRVDAGIGIGIDLGNTGLQALGVDAELLRQFCQGVGLGQITIGQEGRQTFSTRFSTRSNHADAIFAQRLGIANQVGGDGRFSWSGLVGLLHR